jgi:hypothetical protein
VGRHLARGQGLPALLLDREVTRVVTTGSAR